MIDKTKELENAIIHLKVRNFTGYQLDMAIKALEMQLPKAIKYDKDGQNECPICKSHVYTDDNYCFNCGQKIFTDLNND